MEIKFKFKKRVEKMEKEKRGFKILFNPIN